MSNEPDYGPRKICLGCRAVKPIEWYAHHGFDDVCTVCRALEDRGELLPPVDSTDLKLCSQCGLQLPKREFGVDKQTNDGLRSRCIVCRQDETAKARLARRYRRYVLESRKRNNQVGE